MRTARRVLLPLVAALALLLSVAPAHAADVDGQWTGSIDTALGAIALNFTFTADGQTLSGFVTRPDGGELPIKYGKIDRDRISFVVSLDFGGMSFDLNCNGVVSPDTLKMTSDFMGMPFEFTLKKGQ